MKKGLKIVGIFFLVLIIIANIGRQFRTTYSNSLEMQVEKANRDCPIPVAEGAGQVTAIKLEGNYLTYYLDYKAGHFDVDMFESNKEAAKDMFYMCFICLNAQGGQGSMLRDILQTQNIGMKLVARDGMGKSFTCEMTPEYMKEMSNRIEMNPSEALHAAISMQMQMESLTLPQQIDQGMTMTSYYLSGENIVAEIMIDEDLYDLVQIRENSKHVASSLIEAANNGDHEVAALLDMCKVSHTGIIYRYIGTKSKQIEDVCISSEQIRVERKTPATVNIQ